MDNSQVASMVVNSAARSAVCLVASMDKMWVGQTDALMVAHSAARSAVCWAALTDAP